MAASEAQAKIDLLNRDADVVALVDDLTRRLAGEVPVTADPASWINGMATAFVELKKALPDGAAALREHDLHVISDAERRMFGTTDPGEFIEIADGIPVSEFQRLLWEPYRDTAGEAGDRTFEYRSLEERIDQEAVYELDAAEEAGE